MGAFLELKPGPALAAESMRGLILPCEAGCSWLARVGRLMRAPRRAVTLLPQSSPAVRCVRPSVVLPGRLTVGGKVRV